VMVRLVGVAEAWTLMDAGRAARRVAAMHRERVGRARSVHRSGDRAGQLGGMYSGIFPGFGARRHQIHGCHLYSPFALSALELRPRLYLAAIFAGAAAPVMANADIA